MFTTALSVEAKIELKEYSDKTMIQISKLDEQALYEYI
ncbi:MAG: ribbon-helix-helix domain-containing protein [Fusobacteria bacterium]|nr:ribbon-helix-helix domain-containing protein [Fusobacteriota bacterium]